MRSAYLVLSARTQALWPLPARLDFFFVVVVAVDGVSAGIRTSWLPLTSMVHRPRRGSQAPKVSQHCTQTPESLRDPGTARCARRPCAPSQIAVRFRNYSPCAPKPHSSSLDLRTLPGLALATLAHGSLDPSHLGRRWASPFGRALKRVDNWHGWPRQPH